MTEPTDATAAIARLRAAVASAEAGDGARTRAEPDDGPVVVRRDGPDGHGAGPRGRSNRRTRRANEQAPPAPPDELDAPADPYAVAQAIVLRQLAGAPKTRQQLADTLARRGCAPEVAQDVLIRMAELGYLDDAAYARLYARSKQASRGLSRRAIAHELRTKGVDDETAAEVLDGVDPEDEHRRARLLVDKKLATMHGLEVTVQTRRLAAMLARKGYPGDLAYAVIRDAIADAPEHRRD